MKYGIELEFFVSKNGKIVPAYEATNNLDGNPFIGEIKTSPYNNITDTVFALQKELYIQSDLLESKGYKLELIPSHTFTNEDIVNFRKNKYAVNKKELEVLEEFSIYSNGKLGKLLKRGECKASLQINLSEHKSFSYLVYNKISIGDNHKYESTTEYKEYTCIFNYISILQKLDSAFIKDINDTKRVKGVYAIKDGIYGSRIEYRSLPNNVNLLKLIQILN